MLSPDELNPDYYTSILISIVSPLWQIIDSGKEKSIGKLEFPLTQLIKSESMTIEQPFPLKESGHNSTLTCKFMLKVNFPEKSLPQLLPKDQCPSLIMSVWIWPISFRRPLLTETASSLIVCVKFHLEEFTTSERCELENAKLQTTSSKWSYDAHLSETFLQSRGFH